MMTPEDEIVYLESASSEISDAVEHSLQAVSDVETESKQATNLAKEGENLRGTAEKAKDIQHELPRARQQHADVEKSVVRSEMEARSVADALRSASDSIASAETRLMQLRGSASSAVVRLEQEYQGFLEQAQQMEFYASSSSDDNQRAYYSNAAQAARARAAQMIHKIIRVKEANNHLLDAKVRLDTAASHAGNCEMSVRSIQGGVHEIQRSEGQIKSFISSAEANIAAIERLFEELVDSYACLREQHGRACDLSKNADEKGQAQAALRREAVPYIQGKIMELRRFNR